MKIMLIDYFSGKVCISDKLRSRVIYEIPFWNDEKSPFTIEGNRLRKEKNYYELMGCQFHFVPKGTICSLKLQITDLFEEEIGSDLQHEMITEHDCFVAVNQNTKKIIAVVPLFKTLEDAANFQNKLKRENDYYGYLEIMIDLSKWCQSII